MLAHRAYAKVRQRDDLIREGLPLVRRIAFRMARRLPPNVDVNDLIGAGSEGLIKAADAYDPTSHPNFEPYAKTRIRGAILDELRSADAMTRHGRRRLAEVTKAMRALQNELGRPPNDEETAARLGIALDDYHKLVEAFARAPALRNLGAHEPDEVASNGLDPARAYDEKMLKKELAAAISKLPERTRMVLALYYQEECTQAEIGEILSVTESRVCQILGESVARIRVAMNLEAPKPRKRSAKTGPAAKAKPGAKAGSSGKARPARKARKARQEAKPASSAKPSPEAGDKEGTNV
ncbi:MAG: RNA polymerase sigma factor FliA [Myxococcota bacterium]